MDISSVDKNFKLNVVTANDVIWHSALGEPFAIHGVSYDELNGRFCRIPDDVASSVSDGVKYLATNTAGGRVRFLTTSPYVAIRCIAPYSTLMSHITMIGQFGFSVVCDGAYHGRIAPEFNNILPSAAQDGKIAFGGQVSLPNDGKAHLITLFMPLYNGVNELYIGLAGGCEIAAPTPYTHATPVLFYGSSITQGGCASRPGNDYIGLISQWLDLDVLNLGFSGNAKGEAVMAEYLATLDASVFVLDYDHNAPSAEHLAATHDGVFTAFRTAHPTTPVIMITRPNYRRDAGAKVSERKAVVMDTYNKAVASGDRNVYFISGEQLFGDDYEYCTVDGCHPNDLGFYRMAERVAATLKKLL